jgi:hypothetical protein
MTRQIRFAAALAVLFLACGAGCPSTPPTGGSTTAPSRAKIPVGPNTPGAGTQPGSGAGVNSQ